METPFLTKRITGESDCAKKSKNQPDSVKKEKLVCLRERERRALSFPKHLSKRI